MCACRATSSLSDILLIDPTPPFLLRLLPCTGLLGAVLNAAVLGMNAAFLLLSFDGLVAAFSVLAGFLDSCAHTSIYSWTATAQ